MSGREEGEGRDESEKRSGSRGGLKETRIHLKVNRSSLVSFRATSVMPEETEEVGATRGGPKGQC